MSKFFRRGKTRVYFCTSISNPAAPTAAEINAGTNLSANVNDMAGFSYSTNQLPTPALDSAFTPSIGGPQVTDDSSITIYLDSASNPLRTTLAVGAAGFIVWVDYKASGNIAASDKVDVYAVTVVGAPKRRSMGDDPAVWECQFSITAVPNEDVTVA
jgi:hypothetical protein